MFSLGFSSDELLAALRTDLSKHPVLSHRWYLNCSLSYAGTFDKFINVISARTAVGHDSQGQLVLVHVDGQTESRG